MESWIHLGCAYIHEYVLSITVGVGVPEAPTSHSEMKSGIIIYTLIGVARGA